MDALETIREKLAKLKALRDCPGATEGEKAAAQARINQLLARHGLTEESAASIGQTEHAMAFAKERWGRQLWLQCAAWMLQVNPVQVQSVNRTHVWIKLTPLDAADLAACYAYYCRTMRSELRALDDLAKRVQKSYRVALADLKKSRDAQMKHINEDKTGLLDAVITKFKLRGPRPERKTTDEPVKVSDAELADYLKRMQRAENIQGDAWQRGEKMADGQGVLCLE